MQLSTTKVAIVGAAERDIEDFLRPLGVKPVSVRDIAALTVPGAEATDVIVLDLRQSKAVPSDLEGLTQQHPTIGIVIVAPSMDPALMLEALHAGAKGFVAAPLTAEDLKTAIERVIPVAQRIQAGRLVAFVGAKGGVGTTTLAVNVGTALAKLAKGETLLVDLNARYGDAAACLGAEPRFTVTDALENSHKLDLPYMRGLVAKTPDGLELLAAPEKVTAGVPDLVRLRALLDFAKRQYRYTVLDLPRTDPAILEALDDVGTIVVVVSQELTAVRSASRLLESLRQRYGTERVQIALGRQDRHSEISPEDLEKTLRGSVRVFPNEYRRALGSLNRGKPLVLENHSRLSTEMSRFVREFARIEKPAPKQTSLLQRWLRGGSTNAG